MIDRLKEIFYKNKAESILIATGVVTELVAFILYVAAGTNKFNPNLSPAAIIAMWLFIIAGGAQVALAAVKGKTMPIVCFAQYAVGLYAFGAYVITQLNLISNVMYGIMNPGSGDGNSLGAAMIITTVFTLSAWVLSLVGAIMLQRKEKRAVQDAALAA